MFDKTVLSFSAINVMSNVALAAGSSQHGNALLASGALMHSNYIIEYFFC
jgi:hypothetical protein